MNYSINNSWQKILENEFNKEYFKKIESFVKNESEKGKIIYPKNEDIFNVFKLVDFNDVKVIILGQDPYHGINQAHGLSFSVLKGQKIPPSLKNIYKEINQDLNISMPSHGFLEDWTKQGVFLMNAILTVNAKEPASHKKAGWEYFTDSIIKILSERRAHLVFMLWGNFAKNKEGLIDNNKHLILKAPHPSPFSAHTGFYGCKHFSKANDYLKSKQKQPIDWRIQDNTILF